MLSDVRVDHRKGPRRRGEELEDAIMRAAMAELTEVGYLGVSMERIASRARTSKAALYRRWTGRADLVADAYFRQVTDELEIPDSGELRTDVLELLLQVRANSKPELVHLLFALLAEVGENDVLLTRVREQLALIKPALLTEILARAEQRGEVRPNLPERLRTLPIDLIRSEILVYGGGVNVPESVVFEIVDDVFLPLVRA